MRVDDRSPWPQWTTVVVGVLLLISGLLQAVVSTRMALPVTDSFIVPLAGGPVSFLAAITRAGAFLIAATGMRGELGLVAGSKPGRAALIIWGLRDLVFLLVVALPASGASPDVLVAVVPQLVVAVAGLVAAVSVVRARVLAGWARWVLVPLAVFEALLALVLDLPVLPTAFAETVALALTTWPTQFVEPVLMLAAAGALLSWGRLEAVKHRARIIHDAW